MWLRLIPLQSNALDQVCSLLEEQGYSIQSRVEIEPTERDYYIAPFRYIAYYIDKTSDSQITLVRLLVGDICDVQEVDTLEGTLELMDAIHYFWNSGDLTCWHEWEADDEANDDDFLPY